MVEFLSLIAIPLSIMMAVAAIFLGVALCTKKNRHETIQALRSMNFGSNAISAFGLLWVKYFHTYFGLKYFAKRQLLSIPIYTIITSLIFFLIWISYLYLFKNNANSLIAPLPISVKQAIYDFYSKGIFAAFILDFLTIQLTKKAIAIGVDHGYGSFRFFGFCLISLVASFFVFTSIIFAFRVADMVSLYMDFVPTDLMPVIPYEPFKYIPSSLNLFAPQTHIYVTSKGFISTYFMPEPLLFYCAVVTQTSICFITFCYLIGFGIEKIRVLSISFVTNVGTPRVNAYSVMVFCLLTLIGIPISTMTIWALATR